MKTWNFNKEPLLLGENFPQPQPDDFPALCFKNASREYVLRNTTKYVRDIIGAIPLRRKHRFISVDVKVHDIEPGRYPCIPGWHTDTVIDPRSNGRPEVHTLFVTGFASLTEFIGEQVCLTLPTTGNVLLEHFRAEIDAISPQIRKIPSCQLVTYGRYDFHRGSLGLSFEKRLLIRVSETDIIKPQNKPQVFTIR